MDFTNPAVSSSVVVQSLYLVKNLLVKAIIGHMPGDVARVWLRISFFQALLFMVPYSATAGPASSMPIHLRPWKDRETDTPIITSSDASVPILTLPYPTLPYITLPYLTPYQFDNC